MQSHTFRVATNGEKGPTFVRSFSQRVVSFGRYVDKVLEIIPLRPAAHTHTHMQKGLGWD